ncbi:MAG: selenium cofactor biosynthesis protein YqeC [Clostridia bacterium]|nr:selenium cofactor biosynthesis protein YqeC [Clostridia bacterium]
MIQAFVGSGGKTGTIMARTAECRAQGLRVLVTTSTHIGARPDAVVGDDADAVIRALRETGYALAGRLSSAHKIGALSEETYLAACAGADVVLVEADGSRQLPLKFPAAYEPVIPENADEIVIVAGLSALGRPAREVCHRLDLVKACLGIDDDTLITPEHVERLLWEGYVKPLRARYPQKKLTILPRQCDTLYKRAVGALLSGGKPVSWVRPAWFAKRTPGGDERAGGPGESGVLCIVTRPDDSGADDAQSVIWVTKAGASGGRDGFDRRIVEDARRTEEIVWRDVRSDATRRRVLFIPLREEVKYIDPHGET